MKVAIVTGVSKGLGESIAKLLINQGIYVHGISRSENKRLAKETDPFTHYRCDLGNLNELEETIAQIKSYLKEQQPKEILLINNAAVLNPINHSMEIKNEELAYHVQVNTIAPMVLMNNFLRIATEIKAKLIGSNVTSGAAESGMYGWSAYCSTKASINMYTETVALEQSELQTEHKVIAFSPGVMDTKMQASIRASSSDAFKDVEAFKALKEHDQLNDTDKVGKVLVNILNDKKSLSSGKVYYVRDYF